MFIKQAKQILKNLFIKYRKHGNKGTEPANVGVETAHIKKTPNANEHVRIFKFRQNIIENYLVYGTHRIEAGTIMYRGCRADSQEIALGLLQNPRFMTINRDRAINYSSETFNNYNGINGYLIKLRAVQIINLRMVRSEKICRELLEFKSPHRERFRHLQPAEMQRLELSGFLDELCIEPDNTENYTFNGYWDNDGEDILILAPMQKCEVMHIELL